MLRFRQGEIAIYLIPSTPNMQGYVGLECEVVEVGPYPAGSVLHCGNGVFKLIHDADYSIRFSDVDGFFLCRDVQLRKKDAPAEPIAMIRHEEVKA